MAKQLRRIYLAVHVLCTLDLALDDPRRRTRAWDQFPHRIDLSYRCEELMLERYRQLVMQAGDDDGMYFLPTGYRTTGEFAEFAARQLGPRSVVSRVNGDPAEWERILGSAFFEAVERDQLEAIGRRGLPSGHLTAAQLRGDAMSRGRPVGLPSGGLKQTEIRAWAHSKAWAEDLRAQFTERGYTFDPETLEIVAIGGDWSYCGASFPIQIVRALGLSKAVERRFDLMVPDEGPLLLHARLVDQNLSMPEQVRLFIYETADAEGLRYVAQYFEGMRGIMDPGHTVTVGFPEGSACDVNLWGIGTERAAGLDQTFYGRMTLSVGSGGHTPFGSTLVMAQPELSLEDFRSALLAGEVLERKPGPVSTGLAATA